MSRCLSACGRFPASEGRDWSGPSRVEVTPATTASRSRSIRRSRRDRASTVLFSGPTRLILRRWEFPCVRGETFEEKQRADRPREVIINEAFVRQYFPGEDPIGKHLVSMGHQVFDIIGVVGDTRSELAQPPLPVMYFPIYAPLYDR